MAVEKFFKMRSYLNTISVMHNILCTESNKWICLGDLLILLYAAEMGRKCIQIGTKLSATHTINYTMNYSYTYGYDTSAYFAKLHYKNM